MAHLADYQGKLSQVRALLLESIEHARAIGDDNQVGEALCWLARNLYQSGELAAARAALDESAALLRRTGDIARLAGTLYIQGEIEAEQGEHAAARAALARSSDLYRQAGDRVGETKAIGWLGYACLHAGDHPAAWQYLLDCVERGREYFERGAVTCITRRDAELHAEVQGSQYTPYEVHVTLTESGITKAVCSCPYGESWDGACKHIVATLLACLRQPDQVEEHPTLERVVEVLHSGRCMPAAARSPRTVARHPRFRQAACAGLRPSARARR